MDYRKNPKGEIKTTYTYNYVSRTIVLVNILKVKISGMDKREVF